MDLHYAMTHWEEVLSWEMNSLLVRYESEVFPQGYLVFLIKKKEIAFSPLSCFHFSALEYVFETSDYNQKCVNTGSFDLCVGLLTH